MTQQPQRRDESVRALMDEAVRDQIRNIDDRSRGMRILQRSPRAVVLDANMLRGEIGALARRSHDTALVTLAKIGFLIPCAATHVLAEIEEHAERWAAEMSLPPETYLSCWRSVLLPLLVPVDLSPALLTADERTRIDELNKPSPIGDPDDVPTAIAAMVLEAPLLSNDNLVLRAVYGPDHDAAAHRTYAQAFLGAGKVLIVSELGWAALFALRLAWSAGSGVRALASRTGPTGVLIAVVASARVAASPRARDRVRNLAPPAKVAIEMLLELWAYYLEAEQSFSTLAVPLPWDEDDLTVAVADQRRTAREWVLRVTHADITSLPADPTSPRC